MKPTLSSFDIRIVDDALEGSPGYILDFTNVTFERFFQEFGIDIYSEAYSSEGESKAKRLRCFLRQTDAKLAGRVLDELLRHRMEMRWSPLNKQTKERYEDLVARLLGARVEHQRASDVNQDAETRLRSVKYDEDIFRRLPVPSEVQELLIQRMYEARACGKAGAYLAAVILSGSVLEGMCLGFGTRNMERVNRAYQERYDRRPGRLSDWKLVEWLDVLGRLGVLSPNVTRFGHSLREFRNYIHPAEQLRQGFVPDRHTAGIGFQVVVAAAEEIAAASDRRTIFPATDEPD